YENTVTNEKTAQKERIANQIAKQNDKINDIKLTIDDYIEYGQTDDAAKYREKLKVELEKLKELKSGKDTEFDEKLKKMKERYDQRSKLIDKVRVGKFFEYESNIYCVTQISFKAFEGLNIFTAPSNININFSCTDPLNAKKGISYNFADDGFAAISDISAKASSQSAYEKFLKEDNRREEVSIITGNIVPYLSEEGTKVITRYSLEDGSMENGIVVKPELKNGKLEMPEMCQWATVPVTIKTKRPIMASLTSASRVDFLSPVGHGSFYITGIRRGNDMAFQLIAERGYKEFLFKPETLESIGVEEVPFKSGEFNVYVENISRLLDVMSENKFSARVAFANLTQYADALDFSKYKPKDWKPLGYDPNKIPSSKNYSYLLIKEMELAFGESKSKKKTTKNTDSEPESEVIRIVDYSEKSWAVYGGSQKEWGKLKRAGAKYNSRLADGKGWILPKSKYTKSEILKLVA
ncbi:MAG: hypothetical protein IJ150_14370, partial [Bacteroidales bacterium]|nr:hypothetical protein [Bacteroidales bacterium]